MRLHPLLILACLLTSCSQRLYIGQTPNYKWYVVAEPKGDLPTNGAIDASLFGDYDNFPANDKQAQEWNAQFYTATIDDDSLPATPTRRRWRHGSRKGGRK